MTMPAMNPVTKAAAPSNSEYISSVSPLWLASEAKMSGEPFPKASSVTPARFSLNLRFFEMTASAGQKLKEANAWLMVIREPSATRYNLSAVAAKMVNKYKQPTARRTMARM